MHATRAALEREEEPQQRKWTLQVDLENLYNRTNRSEMMAEVRRHFPESSYGTSYLNFGTNTVLSTRASIKGTHLQASYSPSPSNLSSRCSRTSWTSSSIAGFWTTGSLEAPRRLSWRPVTLS